MRRYCLLHKQRPIVLFLQSHLWLYHQRKLLINVGPQKVNPLRHGRLPNQRQNRQHLTKQSHRCCQPELHLRLTQLSLNHQHHLMGHSRCLQPKRHHPQGHLHEHPSQSLRQLLSPNCLENAQTLHLNLALNLNQDLYILQTSLQISHQLMVITFCSRLDI